MQVDRKLRFVFVSDLHDCDNDMLISEIEKNAPDALLVLVNRHSLELSRSVMIGDRDIDVLAGKNAGMDGILMDDENFYPDLEVTYKVKSLAEIKDCIKIDA